MNVKADTLNGTSLLLRVPLDPIFILLFLLIKLYDFSV